MASEPVVCLHGLGRTPSDWDGVRPALAAFGPVRTPAPARPRTILDVDAGAVLVGHSMGAVLALRIAAQPGCALRAVVLSGCFFPPARNGRPLGASVADYAGHRIAFLRELRTEPRVAAGAAARPPGRSGALRSLVRFAARPAEFDALAGAVRAPVLVVHARDDHHVPLDFALAAANRHPTWSLRILDRGGHHAHVTDPAGWLAAVVPWLAAQARSCAAE